MKTELTSGKNPYTANVWAYVMCIQRCSQTLAKDKLKYYKIACIYNDAFDDGRYFQYEVESEEGSTQKEVK